MNSEEKVDQHRLLQNLIEQSRESHWKQEQLVRQVVATLPVNLDLVSETLWLLQKADNAVTKAERINEHFEVGSKAAADVLSLVSDLEKSILENLRKIRGKILDTGDAESKQIDRESLRNMKNGNMTLDKDFAGDEFDSEEVEVRSKIALKIITSPILDWRWVQELQRWSGYSKEGDRLRYFKDLIERGTSKKIPAEEEELDNMALLYWVASKGGLVASKGGLKGRAAYTQTQIAKLLGWKEENYKVSRCLDIIKEKIKELITHHPDYKEYLANKEYWANKGRGSGSGLG